MRGLSTFIAVCGSMLQNVLSFFTKYQPYLTYFQLGLGVWQILKSTLPGVFIQGVMGWLLSFALPGFFPAYEQLRHFRGCLFKRVKCVVLIKENSQSKTKRLTKSKTKRLTNSKKQVTTTYHRSAYTGAQQTGTIITSFTTEDTESTTSSSESVTSKPPAVHFQPVDYLGETFVVEKEGNKVFVNGEMSYYISDGQWKKICQMEKICFRKKDGKGSEKENEIVFVKGRQNIWEKVATGKVMEFEEVLDDVILENNNTVEISNNVWLLPVDLSEKLEGKLRKLLNLVALFCSTRKKPPFSLLANFFSILSAIFEIKPVKSCIYWIINKMFCRSVQYICNKLPYPVRRFVYLLFIRVENLKPRNDILLKVERYDYLNVVIGGSAKSNSKKATQVDWLDKAETYEFRRGCSIVMQATYNDDTGKCTATVQHTNLIRSPEQRVIVNCPSREEFRRIGTFLKCLADSKAGSLFKYDRNDNIVHVRKWRESLRHYVDAEFPEIYTLTLDDVIV